MIGNQKGQTNQGSNVVTVTGIVPEMFLSEVKKDVLTDDDTGDETATLLFVFKRKTKQDGVTIIEDFAYREYDPTAGDEDVESWKLQQVIDRVSHIYDTYAGFGANEGVLKGDTWEEYFDSVVEAFSNLKVGEKEVAHVEVYLHLSYERDKKKTQNKAKVNFPNKIPFMEVVKYDAKDKKKRLKPATIKKNPSGLYDINKLAAPQTMAGGAMAGGMTTTNDDEYDTIDDDEAPY